MTELSADARMVLDAADRILREQCGKELVDAAEAGDWPAALWGTLEEAGLPRAAAPEALGGAGLPLAEAMGLLRLVGTHAVPVPLADTLLAASLLGDAGAEALPEGPLALAVDVDGAVRVDGDTLSGRLRRVAFAPVADAVVVCTADGDGVRLHVIEAPLLEDEGRDLAGEPEATVVVDGTAAASFTLDADLGTLFARQALTRAVMISGAMQSILDLGCGYATERTQFGRPIAKFQAVQQQLAVLAGDAAAAIRAADRALEALGGPDEAIEIAVAKARAGEAAGRGAEIAHQVHGAMGFTYEHSLHQRTRRLWNWRDQCGHEARWQAWLGRRIAAAGPARLWGFLTRSEDAGTAEVG